MAEKAERGRRLNIADLKGGGYETVVLAACDMQGRLFGKRMPIDAFVGSLEDDISVSSCALAWDIAQTDRLQVAYAGYHTGWHDIRLVPDLRTIRPAPWLPATAVVLADVVDKSSEDLVTIAPRTILRRQVEALARMGLQASVGGELEYFVFREDLEAARTRGYTNLTPTTPMRAQDLIDPRTDSQEPFFRQLRAALLAAGLEVISTEAEWGRGQWELNLLHSDPLDMADQLALTKYITKTIAMADGRSVTFMARPIADDTGSSCHLHISLRDDEGQAVFADETNRWGMSSAMLHALAGLLERTPELMIFYAPTVNSYKRTDSKQFAGRGTTWGFDNRTVSCRVVGSAAVSKRIEFRVPGADVNPYLAIAGALSAICQGLSDQVEPPPPTLGNAYKERPGKSFPGMLSEASEMFSESKFVLERFGHDVQEHYGAHSAFEAREFARQVTDWERERYFESI